MYRRSDVLLLQDIRVAVERIRMATNSIDQAAFESDVIIQDAVIRNFEVIGEAAKNLSMELRAANDDVDWEGMRGFRNFLIHGYFGVSSVRGKNEGSSKLFYNTVESDFQRGGGVFYKRGIARFRVRPACRTGRPGMTIIMERSVLIPALGAEISTDRSSGCVTPAHPEQGRRGRGREMHDSQSFPGHY